MHFQHFFYNGHYTLKLIPKLFFFNLPMILYTKMITEHNIFDTNTTSYTLFIYTPFFFLFLFLSCSSYALLLICVGHHPAIVSASHHLWHHLQLSRTPLPATIVNSIHLCKSVNNHPFSSSNQTSLSPLQIHSGQPPATVCRSLFVSHVLTLLYRSLPSL